MTIELTSLAQFKRWLTTEGAQMRIIQRDVWDSTEKLWRETDIGERIAGWRDVAIVQSNSFALRNPEGVQSWCDFGKAREWTFGYATARLTGEPYGVRLTYELRIKGEDK